MGTTKVPPYPPVRPLDPAWLGNFLSASHMDKKMIKRIQTVLGKYNKACQMAAKTFEEDFKKLSRE
jgi:hypothetical protein